MTTVPLSQVGKIVTGKTPKTSIADFFGGETPFVTPSDMDGRRTIHSTARTLSDRGVQSVKNCVVPKGAVMVSCIGSDMGKAHIAGSRSVTNQQINTVIVAEQKYETLFVYYNLFGRRAELRDLAAGAAQPILNKTEFGKIVIDFPSLDEQKSIVGLLGALDDKIELNHRIGLTLEEMAQALYRSWFVDFDPVHARALGRPPAHMDATTTALFPDSFGPDDLPKGWSLAPVASVGKCLLGGTPARKNPEFWDGDIAWINSGAINEFRIVSPSELITAEGLQRSAAKVLPVRTTVLAITGATLGQVSLTEIETAANQSVVGIVSAPVFQEFIYCSIRASINNLIRHQTGGAQQHINKGNVAEHQIINPGLDLVQAFKNFVMPMFDMIAAVQFENRTLGIFRDSLLPRLMSGELRIRDAEKQVEEVV